ncbi:FO synthase [Amycolatopsis mediterranei]|uniref:FO synthase n=1 Tax=Amycolatopsis mediterranei TaxID=33910 RepID=UPI0029FF5594|nr:FO synthase [Amycolatopsis mediterranei]
MPQPPGVTVDVSIPPLQAPPRPNETALRRAADGTTLGDRPQAREWLDARGHESTEVCMQDGIDPKLPVGYYADIVRAITAEMPGMHVHTFPPMEIVSTLGIRSSSAMMYDHPGHGPAHLRVLARIAEETGGLTEFAGLPCVHHNAPIHLAGIARPGPTRRRRCCAAARTTSAAP